MAIATPVPTHAALAERVLAAGKHCFVEKPLAQNSADAERLVEAAERRRPGADGGPPARVPPGPRDARRHRRGRRARRHPLHLRQPPQPRQAARGGERALEPRRARRVGAAAPGGRGAVRVHGRRASPTCGRAWRTWSSASCASPPAWPRTCTSPGSIRTRSAASRWSARRRWPRSTTWTLERKLTIYDKGFDEDFSSYGEYIARSGDDHQPARAQRRAAADRVPPLRRLRARRAARRARTARAACAWCGCSSSCSARSTKAGVLRPSDRAPGLLLGRRRRSCRRPSRSAGNVVIHEGTVVGGEATIQDGAIVGKPLALGARSVGFARPAAAGADRGRREGLRGRGGRGRGT